MKFKTNLQRKLKMKIKIISLIVFLLPVFAYAQAGIEVDKKELALVSKVQGYYVYVKCEPYAEYEVVDEMTSGNGVLAESLDFHFEMDDIIKGFISKVRKKNRKAEKKDEPLIEGIIVYDHERASAIRFIEDEDGK